MGNTASKSKTAASQSSVAKRAKLMPKHESKSSEAKPAAQSTTLCRLTEFKDTAEYIGSFLEAPDFPSLCRASKSTHLLFSKQLHEMALLKAVFDANPEEVQKILKLPRPPKSKCIVLAKTHIKETYPSKRETLDKKEEWKRICKRKWSSISPLEAAAWCGDIFLVRDLLFHVPPTQKPEACKQLKGILNRKESEQNGTFLAPFRALIQAYETYNGQFNTLYTAKNYDELKKLWNEVWQKQRSLSTYGLQEYCDDKPFSNDPPPTFTEPPKRSCYLYNDPNQPLDLDSMDFGYALYKGWVARAAVRVAGWPVWFGWCCVARGFDLAAISRLCEVRTIDLGNLIKELEGPKPEEESDFEDDKADKDSVRP